MEAAFGEWIDRASVRIVERLLLAHLHVLRAMAVGVAILLGTDPAGIAAYLAAVSDAVHPVASAFGPAVMGAVAWLMYRDNRSFSAKLFLALGVLLVACRLAGI